MIQSAPEPPTTTPGVDVPGADAPGVEPEVATAAPPALPLLSSPSTIVVASQGPVPVPVVVALPATGPVTEVPLVSASLLVAVGAMAVLAARRHRARSL